ncbi:MAG: hypothetical protein IKZ13_01505 [Akkermansia sp.]|nr:hypothetical protein [Akkermansia sp.]
MPEQNDNISVQYTKLKAIMGKKIYALPMERIIFLSFLYLLINVLLFLIGWFEPYVSIPLGVVLLWYVFVAYRDTKSASPEPPDCWSMSLGDLIQLALLLLLLFYAMYKTGIMGGYPTHYDYKVFRNALYHNLIDAPWPLVLPDGNEMSYYLSGFLFPAILSRFTQSYLLQQFVLGGWVVISVFLAFVLLFAKLKKVSWCLVLFSLFISTPFDGWSSFSWINKGIQYVSHLLFGIEGWPDFMIGRWHGIVSMHGLLAISAPILVGAMLVTMKSQRSSLVPLLMAMLAAISPLGAVGLLPIAFFVYVQAVIEEKKSVPVLLFSLIVACTLACCFGIYFLRSSSDTYVGLSSGNWGLPAVLSYYVPTQLLLLLMCFHVLKIHKNNLLFMVIFLSISICPFFFIGSRVGSMFSGLNELWFKSRPVYVLLLCYVVVSAWRNIPIWGRSLWFACSLSMLLPFVSDLTKDITFHPRTEQIKDELNGHLYHPTHAFLKQSCPPCKDVLIPGIIMRESGRSEKVFPGCLLPKAKGCNYARVKNSAG